MSEHNHKRLDLHHESRVNPYQTVYQDRPNYPHTIKQQKAYVVWLTAIRKGLVK